MDDHSARYFTALRDLHFPPDINYLSAHLTLFHNLPACELLRLAANAKECCDGNGPVLVNVTGLRFLGRGVAYKLESTALASLRRCLVSHWDAMLQAQDRQPFQPHITIQNKVSPEKARKLHQDLTGAFQPFSITGTGIDFWHYRGGPWEHAAFITF